MAVANELLAVTYVAGEAIGLGVGVMMSTAAAKTVLIATSSEKCIGYTEMAVASGAACPVVLAGRVKVRTGAAIATPGVDLTVAADGRSIAATAGLFVIARAEEAATGADMYISALIAHKPGAFV